MKLLINYDFFNAIKNVNEPLHPLKIVRNEKRKYAIIFPIYLSIALLAKTYGNLDNQELILAMLRSYGYCLSFDIIAEIVYKRINHNNMDFYANHSSEKLKRLAIRLNDINVRTNYNLLLSSELYEKKYSIDTDTDKKPNIICKKYIYVPSYTFDGEEKITSILQEHPIGTKTYILSQDEPDKQYRRVLAKSHI